MKVRSRAFLQGCSVCGIFLQGFQRKFGGSGHGLVNGKRTTSLRYGNGIYFTSSFPKVFDFSIGSEVRNEQRTFRTMFMVTVAAGRSCAVGWKKCKAKVGLLLINSAIPLTQFGSRNAGPNTFGYLCENIAVYDDDAAVPSQRIAYSL